MRVMDSNFRGCKSESGILMPNSRSRSLTKSGSAKESRKPESNSDSSGSGGAVLFEALRTMARMRSLLSIGSFRADREKAVVLRHQLVEEHTAGRAITG